MKTVYVILADGFEDVEAITPIDYLRRASLSVSVVGLNSIKVKSSHDLLISCDVLLEDVLGKELPNLIVLPGGLPGSQSLADSNELKALVEKMWQKGKFVSAICAAPFLALGSWGLLENKNWTGYPGFGEDVENKPKSDRVVIDGKLITARGPGCAEEFSLALIEALCGKEERDKIAEGILAR